MIISIQRTRPSRDRWLAGKRLISETIPGLRAMNPSFVVSLMNWCSTARGSRLLLQPISRCRPHFEPTDSATTNIEFRCVSRYLKSVNGHRGASTKRACLTRETENSWPCCSAPARFHPGSHLRDTVVPLKCPSPAAFRATGRKPNAQGSQSHLTGSPDRYRTLDFLVSRHVFEALCQRMFRRSGFRACSKISSSKSLFFDF